MSGDNAVAAKPITAHQAVAVVLILTISMDIRVLPLFATQPAEYAGWVAVGVQYLVMLGFFHIFYRLLIAFPGQSFLQIVENIWGKVLARLVVFLYILWLFLMLALSIHMFCARLTLSQYPEQNSITLIGIFALFAVVILGSGIVPVARMARFCLTVLLTVLILLILMWIPSFRLENFMPVTYLDTPNIAVSGLKVLYTGAFSMLILVLGDKIASRDTLRRLSFRGVTLLSVIKLGVVVAALGILGPALIPKIPFAMNTMINSITFSSSLERIDSFMAILFTLADFMFLGIVSFCLLHLLRSLFSLSATTPFLVLLGVSLLFGGYYIGNSFFAVSRLEDVLAYPVSLGMGFGIPLLLYVSGKLRRIV
ncbi:MAG: spore germination protein [Peptococcaceae bacterium]|nr:spore germination protein [Peptococcaceae bacterium]